MAARILVSQFVTEEGIAEVHPFAALRDARDDLVNLVGLLLDRDNALCCPLLRERRRLARLPHGELLPKRQVLQRQLPVCANSGSQCPKKDPEPSHHDRPNSLISSKNARESRPTSF